MKVSAHQPNPPTRAGPGLGTWYAWYAWARLSAAWAHLGASWAVLGAILGDRMPCSRRGVLGSCKRLGWRANRDRGRDQVPGLGDGLGVQSFGLGDAWEGARPCPGRATR
jgi:hypothetical protein